jgi:8-oxo-dGTP diphosphatase
MQDFTIRVYGLWIDENNSILLSDERIGALQFTKFPGGGLEKGEGTIACLQREWLEEMQIEIDILSHFYTTDFYQASAFDKRVQVISIYYLIKPKTSDQLKISSIKNDFSFKVDKEESFRKIKLTDLSENMLSYPIDKKVVQLIKEHFKA